MSSVPPPSPRPGAQPVGRQVPVVPEKSASRLWILGACGCLGLIVAISMVIGAWFLWGQLEAGTLKQGGESSPTSVDLSSPEETLKSNLQATVNGDCETVKETFTPDVASSIDCAKWAKGWQGLTKVDYTITQGQKSSDGSRVKLTVDTRFTWEDGSTEPATIEVETENVDGQWRIFRFEKVA